MDRTLCITGELALKIAFSLSETEYSGVTMAFTGINTPAFVET